MDKAQLWQRLDVPTQTPLHLTGVSLVQWGREMHFTADATLDDSTRRTFEMHLIDCREARWQYYTHIDSDDAPAFPRTSLINVSFGKDHHRSPAQLLTGHFGLTLYYGEWWFLYAGDRVRLPLSDDDQS